MRTTPPGVCAPLEVTRVPSAPSFEDALADEVCAVGTFFEDF